MKNTNDFLLHIYRKPSRAIGKSSVCHAECIVRTAVCQKGTSQAEAMSNNEKIKPVALAVIDLCLSESIRLLGSQSVKIL